MIYKRSDLRIHTWDRPDNHGAEGVHKMERNPGINQTNQVHENYKKGKPFIARSAKRSAFCEKAE
jgi:hypothetical protein